MSSLLLVQLMEFYKCLGSEDGCYNDWSMDVLVARKVSVVKYLTFYFLASLCKLLT